MKKTSSAQLEKSAAPSTSRPRRGSEEKEVHLKRGVKGPLPSTDWTKDEWNAYGEACCHPFALRIEALKAFMGYWDEELSDLVMGALFITAPRKDPFPFKENYGKAVGVTDRDILDKWIEAALNRCDTDFIVRLGKCMAALDNLLPTGLKGQVNPANRITAVDSVFIVRHWVKYGHHPEQRDVFKNREEHWEYLGRKKPVILASGKKEPSPKQKPLKKEGIYEHLARSSGKLKKERSKSAKL
ncbi:MAG: hypothetical protein V4675_06970 [Verrucomicrobiota bacterium]